jgi:hypothetical protein
VFFFLAAGLLISCAPQQRFVWGSYESELYDYYKDPEKLENLMKALETAIADGEEAAKASSSADEAKPRRIAPGLYAEYGYLLMIKNDGAKARSYFEKEKQSWPESTVLMDKMIAVIDQGQGGWSKQGIFEKGKSAK